jgi:hypothetical protein
MAGTVRCHSSRVEHDRLDLTLPTLTVSDGGLDAAHSCVAAIISFVAFVDQETSLHLVLDHIGLRRLYWVAVCIRLFCL